MREKLFRGGKIRRASYDAGEKRLEISFEGGELRIYRAVPSIVWEKLCASPNPAAYREDRIAEEYPESKASSTSRPDAHERLNALFSAPRTFPDPERES